MNAIRIRLGHESLDVTLPEEALAFYEQIREASHREHVAFFVGPRGTFRMLGPVE